jgi:hypothetical protein
VKRWTPEGKKPRSTAEDDMQAALVELLRLNACKGVIFYMVPNGTNQGKAAAGRAKAMGLTAGVYDLAGVLPPDGLAWFLELKTRDGVVSPDQENFGVRCERAGALHHVAFSLDSAIGWLVAIGAMKPVH